MGTDNWKIIYLMGKSSTGKDTIYKRLLETERFGFRTIPLYTTRPIREGEHDGVEYFFTDEAGYESLKSLGKVLEERTYDTVLGKWRYFTVWDDKADLAGNILMIGTLESFNQTRAKVGDEHIIPVYIELEDGMRLSRALERERRQERPQYEEMCRRFLADAEDFSEENIAAAGITARFENEDLDKCLREIIGYLDKSLAE